MIAARSRPWSIDPVSRTEQPLASSISTAVVALRSMIDTGTKAAPVSLAAALAGLSDPDGVI
jgi:hypothetical protein